MKKPGRGPRSTASFDHDSRHRVTDEANNEAKRAKTACLRIPVDRFGVRERFEPPSYACYKAMLEPNASCRASTTLAVSF
jgi:hypothetical protein